MTNRFCANAGIVVEFRNAANRHPRSRPMRTCIVSPQASPTIIHATRRDAGHGRIVHGRLDRQDADRHRRIVGWFECGVVAYSYEAKEALLGVRPETLETQGAVSRETAIEMVSGALARFGATVAVAVTGIAGPTRRHAGQAGRHGLGELETSRRLRAGGAVSFRRRSRSGAAPDRRCGAARRSENSYELTRDSAVRVTADAVR